MRIFYGWIIVAAGFSVLFLTYSLHFAYGVIVPHLSEDLELDRADATAPLSVYIVIYSLLSFITGRLTDQTGPRLVVLIGGILFIIAYFGLSRAETVLDLYIWLGLVAGVAMSAAFVPVNATVVKWFVRRRGLALAISGSGVSAGGIIAPLLVAVMIPTLGWRDTLLLLGISCGLALLLLAFAMVRDPETIGLRPDGDVPSNAEASTGETPTEDAWTLEGARTTSTFWIILGVYTLTWMTVFFPGAHLPFMAKDLGFDELTGGSLLSMLGIGVLSGRWVIGWLSDHIGRNAGLYIGFSLQILGFLLFAVSHALPALYGAALMVGFGVSTAVTLFPAILGDFFGRTHVGAISGLIFAIASAAAAVGPYGGGFLREAFGSYDAAFFVCAGLNAAALALIFNLRPPRREVTM